MVLLSNSISRSRGPARCSALSLSSAAVDRRRRLRCGLLDGAPEFFIALFGDADLDAVRWRAMRAAMRQFARDHAVAHHVAVQIIPVSAVVHAAADVGPVPAGDISKPVGGVP